jgi:hypothetical protein
MNYDDKRLEEEFHFFLNKTSEIHYLLESMNEYIDSRINDGDDVPEEYSLLDLIFNESFSYSSQSSTTNYLSSKKDWEDRKQYYIKKYNVDISSFKVSTKFKDFVKNNIETHTQFFLDQYIKLMKYIPDGKLLRLQWSDGESAGYYEVDFSKINLTRIPYFLRKYHELDKVVLNSNPLTEIEVNSMPKCRSLFIQDCQNLTRIAENQLPVTNTLNLDNCQNLTELVYSYDATNLNDIWLSVYNTQLTSMSKITINKIGESRYFRYNLYIEIPDNFTSFESPFMYENIVFRIKDVQPLIKSFYGINARTSIRKTENIRFENKVDTTGELFRKYFPNIENAYQKYLTYVDLCNKYDMFTNDIVESLYKSMQPDTVFEFEIALKNNYEIERNLIGKLISKLLK